jgi:TonB family protein
MRHSLLTIFLAIMSITAFGQTQINPKDYRFMVLQMPKLDMQFPENREIPADNNTFYALSYDDTNNTAFVYNDYVCGYYEVPTAMRAGFKTGARNLQAENPDEYWKLVKQVMDEVTANWKKKTGASAAAPATAPATAPAASTENTVAQAAPKVVASDDPNYVYDTADVMPSFLGGPKALTTYLVKNTRYPESAMKAGHQGRVLCSFIVETDGTISDIKVVKRAHALLDAEALRVARLMPKWEPGKDHGKVCRSMVAIPIGFEI